jgi:hypothetical protein
MNGKCSDCGKPGKLVEAIDGDHIHEDPRDCKK